MCKVWGIQWLWHEGDLCARFGEYSGCGMRVICVQGLGNTVAVA